MDSPTDPLSAAGSSFIPLPAPCAQECIKPGADTIEAEAQQHWSSKSVSGTMERTIDPNTLPPVTGSLDLKGA